MQNTQIESISDQLIEENQEQLISDIFEKKENAQNTVSLIKEMLINYQSKPESQALEEWLYGQFAGKSIPHRLKMKWI